MIRLLYGGGFLVFWGNLYWLMKSLSLSLTYQSTALPTWTTMNLVSGQISCRHLSVNPEPAANHNLLGCFTSLTANFRASMYISLVSLDSPPKGTTYVSGVFIANFSEYSLSFLRGALYG